MRRTLRRTLCLVALTLAAAGAAHAGDGSSPESRARAALALAQARAPVVAAAPAPRPLVSDYAAARRAAFDTGRPVVVAVACEPVRVPGAITAAAPRLGDYPPGTVVVCYPGPDGHMWEEATVPAGVASGEILRLVEAARKKSAGPRPKKTLDWS